jgi:N-acetylneuraminic acid mutarotase
MPRGGWGASAAQQQGTAPALPSGPWTPEASSFLNIARAGAAGAQINNSVFVLGGFADNTFRPVRNEVERLDQVGAPWQLLPALATPRAHPAAAALDGRLYAIGGYPNGPGALTSVEVFEPGQDTAWSFVAPLPDPKGRGAGAAAAAHGLIYVTGGDVGTKVRSLNSLLAYDPQHDQWQTKAPKPTPCSNLKMVYLDPFIYAIGGIDTGQHDPPLATVERYDPRTDKWATMAEMSTGRFNAGTTVVGNQILVVGGGGGADFSNAKPLQTSEIYSPDAGAGTWTMFSALLIPGRAALTSAAVPGTNPGTNIVLAIGGVFKAAQGFVMTREVDRA